ncbi:unnamed protein product [Acanthoscelides obtectus]|nr:unnamed protein product [Acanthoscelides obtectus]CAK1620821.1 hypothetical protein AOBTE_LOCUS588 [Acanthoscelides obtectus]
MSRCPARYSHVWNWWCLQVFSSNPRLVPLLLSR